MPSPWSYMPIASTTPSAPGPSADHCEPSHRAIPLTGSSPARVKPPATYSPDAIPGPSFTTVFRSTIALSTPPPTSCQSAPSQRARLAAGCPPAAVKSPATYSCGPVPSSSTASSCTVPSMPAASGDHDWPSKRAMFAAGTPPLTDVKSPATYSAGPDPSSITAIAYAMPLSMPSRSPSGLHAVPSQRAMLCASTSPACENSPHANSDGPHSSERRAGCRSCTGPSTPLPTGCQPNSVSRPIPLRARGPYQMKLPPQ